MAEKWPKTVIASQRRRWQVCWSLRKHPLQSGQGILADPAVLEADDTEGEWNVIVENTGKETAAGLWLEDADALDAEQDGYLYFEEDYFYLLPGEKRKVRVYSTKKQPPRIRVSGFNIADKIVKAEKEEDR